MADKRIGDLQNKTDGLQDGNNFAIDDGAQSYRLSGQQAFDYIKQKIIALAQAIINTAHIVDGAVTTPKIAQGAVTEQKLASGIYLPMPTVKKSNASGTVSVELNKQNVFTDPIDGALIISLPPPVSGATNEISVMLTVGTGGSVDAGTTHYYEGAAPYLREGNSYELIYAHDGDNWIVGALIRR